MNVDRPKLILEETDMSDWEVYLGDRDVVVGRIVKKFDGSGWSAYAEGEYVHQSHDVIECAQRIRGKVL